MSSVLRSVVRKQRPVLRLPRVSTYRCVATRTGAAVRSTAPCRTTALSCASKRMRQCTQQDHSMRRSQRFLSSGGLAEIDSSKLIINKAASMKPLVPNNKLMFGQTFSDHMLEVDWTADAGWGTPKISPFGPIPMHPASASLHYGIQCFEGMKAYVDDKEQIRMFRPMKNMDRMNTSMKRLYMPGFHKEEFLKCIQALLRLEKRWIPREFGYSLYIRPTAISTHPWLGVGPSHHVKLYTIVCPVGPYYKEGFAPVKLFADPKNVRAWPGGTGDVKVGGNYAMTIQPQMEAAKKGYAQVLWLFGEDHAVTEVGTMNQFFLWTNEQGKQELLTAPLDGTILPGVTRDSVIQLCRGWGIDVVERHYTLPEILKAVEQNRLIEAFGSGTAAIVSPVSAIRYGETEYTIPLDKNDPSAKAGQLTKRVMDTVMGIQYGKIEHEWSVVVPE